MNCELSFVPYMWILSFYVGVGVVIALGGDARELEFYVESDISEDVHGSTKAINVFL